MGNNLISTVGFYVIWLVLVGCLTVAIPVAGIFTLATGLAITLARPRR